MATIAACIVIGGLVYLAVVLPLKKLTVPQATTFMAAVLASAILVAVVVPNTSAIKHLIVTAGKYFSITADMQANVTQVQSDTMEVRQLKKTIQGIGDQVAKAQNDIRDTCQGIFEMSFLLMRVNFMVGTMPTPKMLQGMTDRTNELYARCFPTGPERLAESAKLKEMLIPPTATPSAAPTSKP